MPNKMGRKPLWGPSGFGNFFNNYTWTMAVYDDQLFVGTMDWSYLFKEGLPVFLELLLGTAEPAVDIHYPSWLLGADLFRFPSPEIWAIPESVAGVGNYTSYGIRTMVSDDALYLGMSNPMNLLTDPADALPEGGWELLQLTATQDRARTKTHNFRTPVAFDVFVPCAAYGVGETVRLAGDLHILAHIAVNPAGKVQVRLHTNPQKLSGVGLTSGVSYQATGASNVVLNGRGLPLKYIAVHNFNLIGQGPRDNLKSSARLHLTVNPDGEITVGDVAVTVDCK